MILKTYKEPTNVVVSGLFFPDAPSTFGITDDYHNLDVVNAKNHKDWALLDTWGGITILTEEEFLANIEQTKKTANAEAYLEGLDYLILEDYVGDISIDLFLLDELQRRTNISILDPNVNLEETDLLYALNEEYSPHINGVDRELVLFIDCVVPNRITYVLEDY